MLRNPLRLARFANSFESGMRRWPAPLIAILLGCVWLCRTTDSRSEPSPFDKSNGLVVISDSVVDLGTLQSGERRPVFLKLGNNGNRRLVVNQLAAGSCCGNSIRDTLILQPSEVTEWVMEVRAPLESGSFEKTTRFTASDPALPQFELVVKGSVR